jgi:hypothetical protein
MAPSTRIGPNIAARSQGRRNSAPNNLPWARAYHPTRSAAGSRQVLKSMIERDSTGTTKATMSQETASAAATVIARVFENAPVTPERKANGTNTIMVARLDPVSGHRNSWAAGRTMSRPRGISS